MTQIQATIEYQELLMNGYSIHYYCSGNSTKDVLIFLHPAFADHHCFEKQIDYFSKEFRVISIDMLGHGLSQVEKGKDAIDETVTHICKILQLEGFSKAHIVGVSMGSLIAQYFAFLYPEKIASLTVLGGYNIHADNRDVAKAQRGEQLKWIFKALFSMDLFRRYVAKFSVSNVEEQEKFYKMAQNFTRKSFMAMSGLGKILRKRDDITISYPLMLLCGENDIELAKNSCKKWHKSELHSIYFEILSAGHCANMDNANMFNDTLMKFLKQN